MLFFGLHQHLRKKIWLCSCYMLGFLQFDLECLLCLSAVWCSAENIQSYNQGCFANNSCLLPLEMRLTVGLGIVDFSILLPIRYLSFGTIQKWYNWYFDKKIIFDTKKKCFPMNPFFHCCLNTRSCTRIPQNKMTKIWFKSETVSQSVSIKKSLFDRF